MHEVSMMMSILELATEKAAGAGASRILSITLEVGARSGVVVEALEFAFDAVTRGTMAEGARLTVDRIPYRGQCLSCGHQFDCDDFIVCSQCGHFGKVISGRELKIKSIEVD